MMYFGIETALLWPFDDLSTLLPIAVIGFCTGIIARVIDNAK